MERPVGIKVTVVLMSLAIATGWSVLDWHASHAIARFLSFTAVILIGYFVIWSYWEGENWARIAVIVCSALAVLNVTDWNDLHSGKIVGARHLMLAGDAALGVFLLYWLNTSAVRAFFRRDAQ